MITTRLYLRWLRLLRYANWLEMIGARQAGNYVAASWQQNRISDLDRQIARLRLNPQGV